MKTEKNTDGVPKETNLSPAWWYTPVINPSTLKEAEAEGSQVQGQPGLYSQTLSQKKRSRTNRKLCNTYINLTFTGIHLKTKLQFSFNMLGTKFSFKVHLLWMPQSTVYFQLMK
jgi:hypothetical protein